MKRRAFLQAGVAMAGGAAAWNEPAGQAAHAAPSKTTVLVTSAETDLARTLAAALADPFQVRLTATREVETDLPFTRSDLEPGEATEALVRDVQVVVHVGVAAPADEEREQVDRWPRQTYHLLQAAADGGVRRVVYLSSLDLVAGYDPKYLVDEAWRPQVPIGSGLLPLQLGEFCCREFAREGRLQVVVLRPGRVVSNNAQAENGDDAWVHQRDLAQAVQRAIEAEAPFAGGSLRPWSVFHILSNVPDSRFPIQNARRRLGYEPEFP